MIKYLVKPGYIPSRNDGDVHFISAPRLMQLYRVNPRECLVEPSGNARLGWIEPTNLIVLAPQYDGDYTLKEQ